MDAALIVQEDFEQTTPTLKGYLLSAGYSPAEDDAFDVAMRTVRVDGEPIFGRRNLDLTNDPQMSR